MKQRTRIVCTLGPASDTDDVVRAIIDAGMDVARLNFSYGDHSRHAARIERVRRIAKEENALVAILGDLQGPKIRVGEIFGGSVQLATGSSFTLTTRAIVGDASAAHIDFADLPRSVKGGERILLDDGLIELQVVSASKTDVLTRVVSGGVLKPHKGVNLPGVPLKISALTEKDRADLVFAVEQELDYIALSFVRRPQDVVELNHFLAARGAMIPVIAKIEKLDAIDTIDAILEVSDGMMVARGDLGVEAPPEKVPIFQKMIIRKANAVGTPVITATQMLESMINNRHPTRAEASDVANAIFDGTDAVMLSAETAVGKYPVEAVQTMERIADVAGENPQFKDHRHIGGAGTGNMTDAIGNATCEIARQLNARVIITATTSGFTARMISRHRPDTPILAVTSQERTRRRLALVWGIQSALVEETESTDGMIAASLAAAVKQGVVKRGDVAVITAGVRTGISGRTNMIQVRVVQ
jgi:pyruvate kinase